MLPRRIPKAAMARFAEYAKPGQASECWLWAGPLTDRGYGVFHCCGQRIGAHRVAYQLANGDIPPGMHILHSCDNPSCVNPSHLRAGTHQENMREALERGRFKNPSGEAHSCAKLTAAQVDEIRNGNEVAPVLARRFGVSKSTIYAARKGHSWRSHATA